MHLARQLAGRLTSRFNDLDEELVRIQVNESLKQLAATIAAVNV